MKTDDSYPPPDDWDSNNATDISILNEVELEQDSENTHVFGNKDKKAQEREKWDGFEAEIVSDDDAENYEEEITGVKIKYTLKPREVKDFIHRSKFYEKNRFFQKKHTAIQSFLLVLLLAFACVSESSYYVIMAIFPFLALVLVWLVPYLNIKFIIDKLLKEDQFTLEIFPGRIEIESKSGKRELLLNNLSESDEYNGLILIFVPDGSHLVIPLRAVEPEFQADVQAMIAAGTVPRFKNRGKQNA